MQEPFDKFEQYYQENEVKELCQGYQSQRKEKIVTQTSLMTLMSCPRKYKFRFDMALFPKTDEQEKKFYNGTVFHKFQEMELPMHITSLDEFCYIMVNMHKKEKELDLEGDLVPTPEQIAELQTMYGVCMAYSQHWKADTFPNNSQNEIEFKIPIKSLGRRYGNFFFCGKIDRLTPDYLWEHKSRRVIDKNTMTYNNLNFQTSAYSYASNMRNVMYDIVRVPKLKHSGEKHHENVCKNLLDSADKSFVRFGFVIPEWNATRMSYVIAELARHARLIHKSDFWAIRENFSACCGMYGQMCEYSKICNAKDQLFEIRAGYEQRPDKMFKEITPDE